MASRSQTKPLNELSQNEVGVLLMKIKFENIKDILFSGDYGEINGEMIEELSDNDLKMEFGISSGLQRKQFLKKIMALKKDGVPLEMLPANNTPANRKILEKLLKKSVKIKKECTSEMDILAFPAKKVLVSQLKRATQAEKLKKIIIMGETGTGKSTLLNAFVNFAAGVEIDDPFRFKLVVDEEDRSGDQTNSQTTEISGYLIENTELGFPVQVWDTPGFGDTGGIERDEEIKRQINELLKIEDECHAICFVVKANVNRLTDIQKYIIDRVLLFFGKEALENIYILATFADGNRPEVLDAIKKSSLPFDEKRWFAFNNADLFKIPSERTEFSKSYWKIVNGSIANFFGTLKHLLAFSLISTKSVIEEREKLKININGIQKELDKAIVIANNSDENLRKLDAEKDQVERTRKFTKKVTSTIKDPVATKNITTFCPKCTHTCHEDCGIPNDEDKARCWAMTNGNCRICPGRCTWDWHKNIPYIYVDRTEVKNEVMTDVKSKHDSAIQNLSTYQACKKQLEDEKEEAEKFLGSLIGGIKFQMEKLHKIAILSHSMDMYKYFQTLAETEKNRGNTEKALMYEKLVKEEQLQINSESMGVEEMMASFRSSKIV